MSLGHEHGLVLIGLAGPMDVVNLSLSLSLSTLSGAVNGALSARLISLALISRRSLIVSCLRLALHLV